MVVSNWSAPKERSGSVGSPNWPLVKRIRAEARLVSVSSPTNMATVELCSAKSFECFVRGGPSEIQFVPALMAVSPKSAPAERAASAEPGNWTSVKTISAMIDAASVHAVSSSILDFASDSERQLRRQCALVWRFLGGWKLGLNARLNQLSCRELTSSAPSAQLTDLAALEEQVLLSVDAVLGHGSSAPSTLRTALARVVESAPTPHDTPADAATPLFLLIACPLRSLFDAAAKEGSSMCAQCASFGSSTGGSISGLGSKRGLQPTPTSVDATSRAPPRHLLRNFQRQSRRRRPRPVLKRA